METIRLPPPPTHQNADDIYGFHLSPEGRSFLKVCYNIYRNLADFAPATGALGYTAMAGAIADPTVDWDDEVALTESSLRRWAETSQQELWKKRAEKNLRVLKRLEQQLMLQPEIAARLAARASSIHVLDTANALALLVYGRLSDADVATIRAKHKRFEGIYRLLRLTKAGQAPAKIYGGDEYWNLVVPDDYPFMLLQNFQDTAPGQPPYHEVCSGFCFVSHNNVLIRFVISETDPAIRYISTYSPARSSNIRELYFADGGYIDPDDLIYIEHDVRIYGPPSTEFQERLPSMEIFPADYALRRDTSEKARFYRNFFSSVIWNIPL